MGISNFSAYRILADNPWVGPRVTKRVWTGGDIAKLEQLWPVADEADILKALPGRSFAAIGRKVSELEIRRPLPGCRTNKRFIHPIIKALRTERERQKLTRPQLASKIGYHWMQLHQWEMGKRKPIFDKLVDWAQGLGMEIIVRPTAHRIFDEKPALPTKAQLAARRAA